MPPAAGGAAGSGAGGPTAGEPSPSGHAGAGPTLDAAIPAADPQKYRDVFEPKDWKNPFVTVRAEGVDLAAGAPSAKRSIATADLAGALAALPASAWPYGRVVAAREAPGPAAGGPDAVAANRAKVAEAVESVGATVEWWPGE